MRILRLPLSYRSRTAIGGAIFALLFQSNARAQDDAGEHRRFETEFHALMQADWQGRTEAESSDSSVTLRRARVGVKGTAFRYVEYELERSLRKTEQWWRDAYVNVPLSRMLEVKGGRFKVPFSREQLTSAGNLDLINRSLGAAYLAPGRDTGLIAHGRFLGRRVRYEAGAFRGGGDNVRDSERRDPRHGALSAGRVVVRPWGDDTAPALLRDVSAGAALTTGRVPAGAYSVRGNTIADVPFFPVTVVQGRRQRYGVELGWRTGPLAVMGEAMRVTDQRLGQSTDDGRLPDILADAWNVTGTWHITGTRQDLPGAVALVVRAEDFRIRSRSGEWTPGNSRGEAIMPRADRAWTVGVTWSLLRFFRIQGNAVREWREDDGVPVAGRSRRWRPMMRFQFQL